MDENVGLGCASSSTWVGAGAETNEIDRAGGEMGGERGARGRASTSASEIDGDDDGDGDGAAAAAAAAAAAIPLYYLDLLRFLTLEVFNTSKTLGALALGKGGGTLDIGAIDLLRNKERGL